MGIGLTWMPSMLPTLMIRAGSSCVPALRRAGTSACTIQNGDLTFRSSTLSHAAAGKLSSGSPQVAPALFTRMSSVSVPASASTASRVHSSWRDRSAGIARTGPNSDRAATACSHASALRELITTSAPACSRPRAIIIPIPRVPPVTSAFFPSSPKSFAKSAVLICCSFRPVAIQNVTALSSGSTRKSVSVISVSRP